MLLILITPDIEREAGCEKPLYYVTPLSRIQEIDGWVSYRIKNQSQRGHDAMIKVVKIHASRVAGRDACLIQPDRPGRNKRDYVYSMFHFVGTCFCMSPSLNQRRFLAVMNVTMLESVLGLIRVSLVLPVMLDSRLHVVWAVRKTL